MFNISGVLASGQKIGGSVQADTYTQAAAAAEKSVPEGDALNKLTIVEFEGSALKVSKPRKRGEAAASETATPRAAKRTR